MMRRYFFLTAFFLCSFGVSVSAQEVHQELKETVRAEVLRILSESSRDIVGTDTGALVQEIQIQIREGDREGEVAVFENDLMKVEPGDSIYVNRLESIDGIEYYQFKDADRGTPLALLAGLFVLVLVSFAGLHGFRALLSLGLSVAAILFVLVPLLLNGYPPVLTSVLVAGGVLAVALFLTHGVRGMTVIAFLGTFGAVILTSLIAGLFVHMAYLTGLSSDEAIYLNFSTKGTLDFGALLLASIIIGILGILDDVAMTQAAVVHELKRANSSFSFLELYSRSIQVGRAHITSLVNTLSFAYVGAALPLVLLMSKAGSSVGLSLNQEVVAAELIRIFVGSIGLILAVPLTTLIAAFWYQKHGVDEGVGEGHHGHAHESSQY